MTEDVSTLIATERIRRDGGSGVEREGRKERLR